MITIYHNPETCFLMLKGHAKAEKNAAGHDLVCCAASMMIDTYHYAAIHSGYIMEVEADRGYKMVRPDPDTTWDDKLRGIYRVVMMGLEMLSREWTDNIRIMPPGDYAA